MKIINTILVFFLLIISPIRAQTDLKSLIFPSSTGLIRVSNDTHYKISGTGFVFVKPNVVLTCAHVVQNWKTIVFIQSETRSEFLLDIIYIDTLMDIAVLTHLDTISEIPYLMNMNEPVSVGDTVIYVGYAEKKSTLKSLRMEFDRSIVKSVGKTHRYVPVDFFEFKGTGRPGYSGGPILDTNGSVVGIFQGVWEECSLRTGDVWLKNRAFFLNEVLKHIP